MKSIITLLAASFAMLASAQSACLETVLDPYYSVQAALAADDLATAKSAALELRQAASDCPASNTDQSCCVEVMGSADTIAKAADIASAREAFLGLSNTLIARAQEQGAPRGGAYKAHCPMAFKGKGGSWLQKSKPLANPYYGASMLRCGTIEALGASEASKGEGKDHSALSPEELDALHAGVPGYMAAAKPSLTPAAPTAAAKGCCGAGGCSR